MAHHKRKQWKRKSWRIQSDSDFLSEWGRKLHRHVKLDIQDKLNFKRGTREYQGGHE